MLAVRDGLVEAHIFLLSPRAEEQRVSDPHEPKQLRHSEITEDRTRSLEQWPFSPTGRARERYHQIAKPPQVRKNAMKAGVIPFRYDL